MADICDDVNLLSSQIRNLWPNGMAKQVITDVIVQFLCYSFSSGVGQSVLFTECGFSVD